MGRASRNLDVLVAAACTNVSVLAIFAILTAEEPVLRLTVAKTLPGSLVTARLVIAAWTYIQAVVSPILTIAVGTLLGSPKPFHCTVDTRAPVGVHCICRPTLNTLLPILSAMYFDQTMCPTRSTVVVFFTSAVTVARMPIIACSVSIAKPSLHAVFRNNFPRAFHCATHTEVST